jgi:hypothetical protein
LDKKDTLNMEIIEKHYNVETGKNVDNNQDAKFTFMGDNPEIELVFLVREPYYEEVDGQINFNHEVEQKFNAGKRLLAQYWREEIITEPHDSDDVTGIQWERDYVVCAQEMLSHLVLIDNQIELIGIVLKGSWPIWTPESKTKMLNELMKRKFGTDFGSNI